MLHLENERSALDQRLLDRAGVKEALALGSFGWEVNLVSWSRWELLGDTTSGVGKDGVARKDQDVGSRWKSSKKYSKFS